MVDLRESFKQPLVGMVTALLVLGLLITLLLANRSQLARWFTDSGSGLGSKPEAVALQAEVSAMIERFTGIEQGIQLDQRKVESNMNRLEGLLRSPVSPDEKTELGSYLRMEENQWEQLREQAELFDRWGSRGKAMEKIRTQIKNATRALNAGNYAKAQESLAQAKSAMEPLLRLRGMIEAMQQARQSYSQAKQELDMMANAHRVAKLPASGELMSLVDAAGKALERGEIEQSTEHYHSAVQRVTEMEREVLATAIEQAKESAAAAIKAGNPARARDALDRVKELGRLQEQLGVVEP